MSLLIVLGEVIVKNFKILCVNVLKIVFSGRYNRVYLHSKVIFRVIGQEVIDHLLDFESSRFVLELKIITYKHEDRVVLRFLKGWTYEPVFEIQEDLLNVDYWWDLSIGFIITLRPRLFNLTKVFTLRGSIMGR